MRKAQARTSRTVWDWMRGALVVFQVALALVLAAGAGVSLGAYLRVAQALPETLDLYSVLPAQGSTIYSADGQLLGRVFDENREVVSLLDVPVAMQQAIVAVEDRRFYQHQGLDPRGIARAFRENVAAGRVVEGGSTLTQQLARIVYGLPRERSIGRKVQEALLALEIDRQYSKEEVLERYLNEVLFGHAAYGVGSAAKLYFGKSVKQLSLAECALLAGLVRSPARYSPYVSPERAKERRNLVLEKMSEAGFITRQQMVKAQGEPIKLAGKKPKTGVAFRAPYFTDYAIRQLIADPDIGEQRLYRGGLTVYTSLNTEMQAAADEALRKGVARTRRHADTQGALVAVDPQSGAILAMVGGLDYSASQFNRAWQACRQPGSAFKAFVYTTAIENGLKPNDTVDATPRYFGGYHPQNTSSSQAGDYSLRAALAHSVNVAAVAVADDRRVTPPRVVEVAHRMGIKSFLGEDLSLALGAYEVSPLDMACAFIPFANGGVAYEPTCLARVVDPRGRVIKEYRPRAHRALSPDVANTMKKMLQEVITRGTGSQAQGISWEAGGKTGTAQDYRDVWFIGFTSGLAASVWVGNDDHSSLGRAFGGSVCAPVWRDFMKRALPIIHYTPPEKDEFDRKWERMGGGPGEPTKEAPKAEEARVEESIPPPGIAIPPDWARPSQPSPPSPPPAKPPEVKQPTEEKPPSPPAEPSPPSPPVKDSSMDESG